MANYGYAVPHHRTRVPGKVDPKALGAGLLAIAPMVGWWRASDLADADLAQVATTWNDRSGAGNHLTKTYTNGPQMRRGYYKSKDWLSFSTNNHMGATSRVAPLSGLTMLAVIDWSGGRVFGLENDTSGSNGVSLYNNSLVIIRDGGATYDIAYGYSGKMIFGLTLGAGGGQAWRNAVALGTTAHTAYGDAGVNFKIGGSGNGGSSLTGYVAEFAIFSAVLTNPQMASAFGYLNGIYGIY